MLYMCVYIYTPESLLLNLFKQEYCTRPSTFVEFMEFSFWCQTPGWQHREDGREFSLKKNRWM